MDFETLLQIINAFVLGLIAVVMLVRTTARKVGDAIEGEDPFEKFADLMDAKVAPIVKKIEDGVDLLNPKTHGGAGKGPNGTT